MQFKSNRKRSRDKKQGVCHWFVTHLNQCSCHSIIIIINDIFSYCRIDNTLNAIIVKKFYTCIAIKGDN